MQIFLAILAFSLLVLVHEFGHFIFAKLSNVWVRDFSIGLGPRIVGFKKGETTYTLRALPFGGACSLEGEDEDSKNDRAFNNKSIGQRFLILVAGSLFNLLAGLLIIFILFLPASRIVEPSINKFADEIAQTGVGGIKAGDEFLKIDGENVYTINDISLLLSRYADKDGYDILLLRNGEKLLLKNVTLVKKEYTSNKSKFTGYGFILNTADNNVWVSAKYALRTAADYVRMVRLSLADLFGGKVHVSDMSGPVGITAALGNVAKSNGFADMMMLVAFISINLGVMNLLPLPALDGGRILFLLLELILKLFKRKPIPAKYEGYVHLAGFAMFMLLILFVTYNDIAKLISAR